MRIFISMPLLKTYIVSILIETNEYSRIRFAFEEKKNE
jgi:hypothetical protein